MYPPDCGLLDTGTQLMVVGQLDDDQHCMTLITHQECSILVTTQIFQFPGNIVHLHEEDKLGTRLIWLVCDTGGQCWETTEWCQVGKYKQRVTTGSWAAYMDGCRHSQGYVRKNICEIMTHTCCTGGRGQVRVCTFWPGLAWRWNYIKRF